MVTITGTTMSWCPIFSQVTTTHFKIFIYECPIFKWVKETWLHNRLPGGWFNIKMPSYQYRKYYCGDKTILRLSYLHNGISYTGKMTSLHWIRALESLSQHWLQVIIISNITFWSMKMYFIIHIHSRLGHCLSHPMGYLISLIPKEAWKKNMSNYFMLSNYLQLVIMPYWFNQQILKHNLIIFKIKTYLLFVYFLLQVSGTYSLSLQLLVKILLTVCLYVLSIAAFHLRLETWPVLAGHEIWLLPPVYFVGLVIWN